MWKREVSKRVLSPLGLVCLVPVVTLIWYGLCQQFRKHAPGTWFNRNHDEQIPNFRAPGQFRGYEDSRLQTLYRVLVLNVAVCKSV